MGDQRVGTRMRRSTFKVVISAIINLFTTMAAAALTKSRSLGNKFFESTLKEESIRLAFINSFIFVNLLGSSDLRDGTCCAGYKF